jgi:small GTP-binding protein
MDNKIILKEIENKFEIKFLKNENIAQYDNYKPIFYYEINENESVTLIKIENFDLNDKLEILINYIKNFKFLNTLNLINTNLNFIPDEIFELKNLNKLVLDCNKINSIPDSISKLSNLNFLSLVKNNIKDLTSNICNIKSLKKLWLDENNLESIPSYIENLKFLTELSLEDNYITFGLKYISNLVKLESLYIGNNHFNGIPDSFINLKNLKILSLRENSIEKGFNIIGDLKNLEELILDENLIDTLPDSFSNLTKLKILSLDNNEIYEIPESFKNLKNLEILTLNNNNIVNGFDHLVDLDNLKELWLEDNNLKEIPNNLINLENIEILTLRNNFLKIIPNNIDSLKNLIQLNISDNFIESLPESITNLKNLEIIDVNGNTLLDPPISIALEGIKRIKKYFNDERVYISKCKAVVIGQGGAGKTSLLDSIIGRPFNPQSDSTHGINIESFMIPFNSNKDKNIELILWDFGGQDIYHATHQFYLADNSLYILVWNSIVGYESGKLIKWLETIVALNPSATILVVATHKNERSVDLPKQSILRKYPNNKILFFEIDNKDNNGIPELIEGIKNEALSKKYVNIGRPKSWIDVIDYINSIDDKYIQRKGLFKIFKKNKVDKTCYEDLSKYLHNIGEILYFPEEELKDTIIIKPEWLSTYIAKVLDSEEISLECGFLTSKHLKTLWQDLSYDIRNKCLRIMEKFDLSYRVFDEKDILKSLIVEKLKLEEDERYHEEWNNFPYINEISLLYKLSTVPSGIPTWFIARTHKYTTYIHWRRGVLLQDTNKEHLGLIIADVENKELTIKVRGKYPNHFFSVLKDTLEFTFKRFPGLNFEAYVPCKGHNSENCPHLFKYEHLIKRISKKPPILHIECPETAENVDINYLLYGIENAGNKLVDEVNKTIEKSLSKSNNNLINEINKVNQLQLKQIQREFIKMFQFQQKINEYSCPNIFTLEKSNNKLSTIVYKLQLYCQNPECMHPVESGKYTVKISKKWFKTFASYYNKMIPFIKIPLMLGSPIIGNYLEEINLDDFNWILESSKEAADMVENLETKTMDLELLSKSMTYLEGSELRVIHNLLMQCDPTKHWGGLEKTILSDGNILWLCPEHKKEHQY